ncbi:MAG: PEP-utilizing enzyme [Actinomycetota bacterium]|nr:PEP-utilizing enzyme [Actinomycetota bacterium]
MFEAPGPGGWVLDTTHFTGPVTRFTRERFSAPVERGFREGTRPYGLLFDHIAWGFVDHWPYLSPRPVPEIEEEAGDFTRESWDRLVASSPGLAHRLAVSEQVFAMKAWRADLDHWDHELKPALVHQHRRLAGVRPTDLSRLDLLAHLDACRENLERSLYWHHRFNVAAVIAVGDFLVHVEGWSGRTGPDVVQALSGTTPLFLGAADHLAAVVDAVGRDPEAVALLEAGDDPRGVLDRLLARPGEAGQAVAHYVERVGEWPVGSGADVSDPTLAEAPQVLVRTIAAAMGAAGAGRLAVEADARAVDLRQAVPAEHRGAFDDLLAEARDSYRLRDERATFSDVWAFGLMRRGILAAGARLTDAGRLSDPAHLIEAGYDEMRALLQTGGGPSGDELAARARARTDASFHDAPPFLGSGPDRHVAVEWLSPGAARTERAFRAYLAAMAGEDDDERAAESGPEEAVRGVAASPGRHEGTVRVVHDADELTGVQDGDVLVARATSPAFTAVLPFVGAIVTDTGGLLSHAAIVAREYRIPAVVGTADATRRLTDGARVRVDGDLGEVLILT